MRKLVEKEDKEEEMGRGGGGAGGVDEERRRRGVKNGKRIVREGAIFLSLHTA